MCLYISIVYIYNFKQVKLQINYRYYSLYYISSLEFRAVRK